MVVFTDAAMVQLEKATRKALEIDKVAPLLSNLVLLDSWFGAKVYCEVYDDFAPYSFTWACYDSQEKNKLLLNGGLIFHGDESGWSIHT